MHKFLFRFFLVFLSLLCLSTSCSKTKVANDKSETLSKISKKEIKQTQTNFATDKVQENFDKWYYFVKTDTETWEIKTSKAIISVPKTEFLPWTEAIRVVGISLMYEKPILLINKAGVTSADELEDSIKGNKIKIPKIFAQKTVDGFYNSDLGVMVKFYTNTIFSCIPNNKNSQKETENDYFLYRYNSLNKEFIPILSTENLNLPKESQLTLLTFNESWQASFKKEINEKVSFNYIEFKSIAEALDGKYKSINHDKFIRKTQPKVIDKDNIKNLSESELAQEILNSEYKNVRTELFRKKSKSKFIYLKQNKTDKNKFTNEISACAASFKISNSTKNIKAILFNTGKLIYSYDGKNWNTKKLPKLPDNFVYSYFIITNNEIWTAWEEQNFFQVGRSGLFREKLE